MRYVFLIDLQGKKKRIKEHIYNLKKVITKLAQITFLMSNRSGGHLGLIQLITMTRSPASYTFSIRIQLNGWFESMAF